MENLPLDRATAPRGIGPAGRLIANTNLSNPTSPSIGLQVLPSPPATGRRKGRDVRPTGKGPRTARLFRPAAPSRKTGGDREGMTGTGPAIPLKRKEPPSPPGRDSKRNAIRKDGTKKDRKNTRGARVLGGRTAREAISFSTARNPTRPSPKWMTTNSRWTTAALGAASPWAGPSKRLSSPGRTGPKGPEDSAAAPIAAITARES